MKKKLIEELSRYRKLMLLSESDIDGVNELVFNPVTGTNGDIGYGYDNGVKKSGISWKGHDDHLHISFTKRDVAMSVINMADKMGLRTSENPYAKSDPNGVIDKVHSANSSHYKAFPGTPQVGEAVDITGNKDAIVRLIKWIEVQYSSNSSSTSHSEVDNTIQKIYNQITNTPMGDIITTAAKPEDNLTFGLYGVDGSNILNSLSKLVSK